MTNASTKRAALYAKLHTGTPGDLAWYQSACAGAASVLELGCGSGRVLEALGPGRTTMVGIDRDLDLLHLAAQRVTAGNGTASAELVCADMRDFCLATTFDRVLLPYTGLYCLADDDEVRACFERVRAHLCDDGRFLFDAYCADALHRGVEPAPEEDEIDDDIAVVEYEGRVYHVREETDWDADGQILEVQYIYEPREGGHSFAYPIRHRYLRLEQLEPLLDAAGLELTSLEEAFEGGPLTLESDHFAAVARRR